MKTSKNHLTRPIIFILFFTVSFFVDAQPPGRCDTCDFMVDIKKPAIVLDSSLRFTDIQNANEFSGCDSSSQGQKVIFFIHGLGGDVSVWDKPKLWTAQNYKVGVYGADYHSSDYETSFFTVCQELNTDLANAPINQSFPNRCKRDDYAIAHSQGGIAARYLDWKWDDDPLNFGNRKFRGLVTFGSPNGGADVALTRTEHGGFITQFLVSMYLDPFYDYRGISQKLDRLIDSTVSFVETSLVPVMIAGLHTNTLDEMAPGSETMDSINAHGSSLHKAAFCGVVEAPECWRVLDGAINQAAEDYPLWGAEKNTDLMDTVNAKLNDHLSNIADNTRKIKRNKLVVWGGYLLFPIKPIVGASVAISGQLAIKKLSTENAAREKAVTFLNNANTQWRYLIGSYHRDSLVSVTRTVYKLTWTEKYGFLGAWYPQEREFGSYGAAYNFYNGIDVYKKKDKKIITTQKTSTHLKYFPSDGVVLKKSQLAFPGVKTSNIDVMNDDSHFQERNSGETKRVFKNLYSGNYDAYFKNEKK